ncbi:hypothetical protein POM88_031694 [Heracleum sosnowskyi]|uniref:RNase H type-1 domain-containing protein n=1 Tax=Heracleum sosnowskyi TaxID=360622 RepID=A0AAD8HY78_9APIA|nr:hypothetical protein POM88_031694 [Heracleum sosnowskyi]
MKNRWNTFFGIAKSPLGPGTLLESGGGSILQNILSGIPSSSARVKTPKLHGERSLQSLIGPSGLQGTRLFLKEREPPKSLPLGGNSKSLALSWEVIAFISSWLEGIVLGAVFGKVIQGFIEIMWPDVFISFCSLLDTLISIFINRIMVDAGIHWTLSKEYFIKINVHSFYLDDPLPNGNRSGIGIVFRNDRGTLVRMIASSLRIQGRRLNELYAMQYALRRAFFENYNMLELETDHGEAYWEWM